MVFDENSVFCCNSDKTNSDLPEKAKAFKYVNLRNGIEKSVSLIEFNIALYKNKQINNAIILQWLMAEISIFDSFNYYKNYAG